ncbi:hypothetical protein GCM10027408_13220 [Microbacterium tumbae]
MAAHRDEQGIRMGGAHGDGRRARGWAARTGIGSLSRGWAARTGMGGAHRDRQPVTGMGGAHRDGQPVTGMGSAHRDGQRGPGSAARGAGYSATRAAMSLRKCAPSREIRPIAS